MLFKVIISVNILALYAEPFVICNSFKQTMFPLLLSFTIHYCPLHASESIDPLKVTPTYNGNVPGDLVITAILSFPIIFIMQKRKLIKK